MTDDNGFLLYQSGYVVDKPHPNTGEMAPDGNLDDEDIEHVHAVVDPGTLRPGRTRRARRQMAATTWCLKLGPDDGPDARVFVGAPEGLVLFRNELTHIFLPCPTTATDPPCTTDSGWTHGRARQQVHAQSAHFEETFNAALANTVDNFRSLQPLHPRTYSYEIELADTGASCKRWA